MFCMIYFILNFAQDKQQQMNQSKNVKKKSFEHNKEAYFISLLNQLNWKSISRSKVHVIMQGVRWRWAIQKTPVNQETFLDWTNL